MTVPGAPSEPAERLKVIYIAGQGRSGSTVLDLILGSVPGVLSLGEVRLFWHWRDTLDAPGGVCSCGVQFRACPFWSAAVEDAFGTEPPGAKDHRRLSAIAMAWRNLPIWPWRLLRRREGREAQLALAARAEALMRAALTRARATALIDSSKVPRQALLLAQAPAFDLLIVQLVRDPRGATASWRRGRTSPASAVSAAMPIIPVWKSAAMWTASHLVTELVRLHGVPVVRLRYEDLAREPEAAARRVLEFAGIDGAPDWAGPRLLRLNPGHLVGGNPVSGAANPLEIRLDDGWRGTLPLRDKLITVVLTWPLLLWYRYPLWA